MTHQSDLLQTATDLYQRGELAGADRACKIVLAMVPDDPVANHLAGIVALQSGNGSDAVRHINRAISLNLAFPVFHANLVLALLAVGETLGAQRSGMIAAIIEPAKQDSLINLATALRENQRHAEAARVGGWAIDLAPDRGQAHSDYALILRELGSYQLALRAVSRAVILEPNNPKIWGVAGLIQRELGQANAQSLFIRALRLQPGSVQLLRYFAESHRFSPGDPWLALMRDAEITLPRIPLQERPELHFSLAKMYEDLGDRESSFDHQLLGAKLKRMSIRYDEAGTLQTFANIRSQFTPGQIEHFAGQGSPSDRPIFIVGLPRSGTSLVEQILASHQQVFGAGEWPGFAQALDHLSTLDGRLFPDFVPTLRQGQIADLADAYLAGLPAEGADYPRITDKMPGNLPFVGMIHLALPNARIIQLRRDPVDACLSCFSKLFDGELNYTYDLGELGRYARDCEAFIEHWQSLLPSDRVMTMVYEELIADPEAQTRRLLEFCGLPWSDVCLDFHQSNRPVRTASIDQVRRPIYKSSVGRWRPSPDKIAPLLAGLGRQVE